MSSTDSTTPENNQPSTTTNEETPVTSTNEVKSTPLGM